MSRDLCSKLPRLMACAVATLGLFSAMPHIALAAPQTAKLSTCHLPGTPDQLKCAHVKVPLDYEHPDRGSIDIHVALANSYRETARPDPLFILAGGPGQAGSDLTPALEAFFRKVRATRDIVLIDQRGTGLSNKLDCKPEKSELEVLAPDAEAELKACVAKHPQSFYAYNSDNAARDIEQVRQALGYDRINLWGGSYGTRLSQVYARRFPEHVRSLILDGVASPDQVIFAWDEDGQNALNAVFSSCAKDKACHEAFPQLEQSFAHLLDEVRAGHVRIDLPHPRTGRRLQGQMPFGMFVTTVRNALYAPASATRLPFLIDSASKGNWGPFLASHYAGSDLSPEMLSILLTLSVTCAEDLPRLSADMITQEEKNSFLAGYDAKTITRWCRIIDVPPIAATTPTRIDAPVLLLSGRNDPVTPPHRAESAMKSMAHAQHFVVEHAGHGVSGLGCAPTLMREFLDHPEQAVDAACLKKIPPTPFQVNTAGPHP